MDLFDLAVGLGGWFALFYILAMIMSGRIYNPTSLVIVILSPPIIITAVYLFLKVFILLSYMCAYVLYVMISRDIIILILLILGILLAIYTVFDTYVLLHN
jgi:hypothetical protein